MNAAKTQNRFSILRLGLWVCCNVQSAYGLSDTKFILEPFDTSQIDCRAIARTG